MKNNIANLLVLCVCFYGCSRGSDKGRQNSVPGQPSSPSVTSQTSQTSITPSEENKSDASSLKPFLKNCSFTGDTFSSFITLKGTPTEQGYLVTLLDETGSQKFSVNGQSFKKVTLDQDQFGSFIGEGDVQQDPSIIQDVGDIVSTGFTFSLDSKLKQGKLETFNVYLDEEETLKISEKILVGELKDCHD